MKRFVLALILAATFVGCRCTDTVVVTFHYQIDPATSVDISIEPPKQIYDWR